MNRVVLAGRITRDPELRTSASGVHFANFSIAVNRFGATERTADFINCVVFNKQAENLARFVKKGALISVDGKLQTRTYQAADGTNRYVVDVICDTIEYLDTRNTANAQPSFDNYQPNAYSSQNYQQPQQGNQMNAQNIQPQPQQFNSTPVEPKRNNSFADVDKKFDITQDELPF